MYKILVLKIYTATSARLNCALYEARAKVSSL